MDTSWVNYFLWHNELSLVHYIQPRFEVLRHFLMSFHAMTKEFSKQVHLFQRPPLLLHCPDRLHPNTKPYLCFWSLERNITSTKLLYKSQHPPMTHPETASKTISLTASQSSLTKTIVWYNNYVVFTPYSRCIHVSYC